MSRPRVVIVGGGYGGVACATHLERLVPEKAVEVVLVSASESLLMTPMLSLSASGMIDPQGALFPLRDLLHHTELIIGNATALNFRQRTLQVHSPRAMTRTVGWDRLVLAPGSVAQSASAPGVAAISLAAKTLQDAGAINRHVMLQLERAQAATDLAERRRHLTFVVVGAGHTGIEFTAQMQAVTNRAISGYSRLQKRDLRWILIHRSSRVLPQMPERLVSKALAVFRTRGVDLRLGTTVMRALPGGVLLSDGEFVPTRTMIWTAGVQPPQWLEGTGLPMDAAGRILVEDTLEVQGQPGVFAIGDAARVPNPARGLAPAPPTLTHAQSQGETAANNLAASLGFGATRAHQHYDRRLVVNLGDREGLGQLGGLSLDGILGWTVAYAHRVSGLPKGSKRRRIALQWARNSSGPGSFTAANHRTRHPNEASSIAAEQSGSLPVGSPQSPASYELTPSM